MKPHIAVLMGGWSLEREVSLGTGKACAIALRDGGYKVTEIDVDRQIADVLKQNRPDICFNALHGPMGEDGNIQGLLNILGIPYTHSGVQASALAMDKARAKELFERAGLKCPKGSIGTKHDISFFDKQSKPFVIKPVDQGSSVGVNIVNIGSNNIGEIFRDWPFGNKVLVEEFIPGRELTVGVFDGEPFCVTEITSERGFYDYNAKYEKGGSIHIFPAQLPNIITKQALEAASCAHRLLGCRGVTRSDFRYDDTSRTPGELYFLEINTQPGMTGTSLVPEQAAFKGINFVNLVSKMVEVAQCDL
ncbi:MAG: D-alanine--D-alanine ligase [Rhodospirillaceae bacterium]|nr:D-alanine--D-alanine ligase [Rhodospirillaceae bacterium]